MKTKYLLLTICLLGGSLLYAQSNKFKTLFDKYEDEDNVTIVSISKSMFNLIPGNIKTNNVDLKSVVSKIESLLIITSENINVKEKMRADFFSLVEKNKDYEELMRVKSDKTNVIFNIRKKGDLIHELIMLVNDEKDFAAIQILGNFTLEDIQNIAKDSQAQ
jgi:hypothetical protein